MSGADLYVAPVGTAGTGGWTWAGTCGTVAMSISTTSSFACIISGYGGVGGASGGEYAPFEFVSGGGYPAGGSGSSGYGGSGGVAAPEWRAQAEAVEAQREAQRQRAAAHAERDARAERLLLSFLTPEQARSYTEDGSFLVTGSSGGRWRIRREGYQGNVDLLDEEGRQVAWWCIHPPGGLPDADAYLAQMLHLVTDEGSFRAIGNAHPIVNLAPVNLGPRRTPPADDFARDIIGGVPAEIAA